MEVSHKVMDALKGIGLNLYERKLWIALLSRGVSTAGELADIAKVPRSRTYDVLQSLADKGFIVIQPSKPFKYLALDPEEAIERVKQKVLEETNQLIEKLNELKVGEVIKELKRIYTRGLRVVEPEEMTGTIRGKSSILNEMARILRNAKDEVLIFANENGLDDLVNLVSYIKSAKDRGTNIRIATILNERVEDKLKLLSTITDVRVVDEGSINLKGNCVVADNSEVLLSLTDKNVDPSQQLALWTRSEHVAKDVFKPIIQITYNNGKSFK